MLHAIVTGAGQGIGHAIAARLHSDGAVVHVCDVDANRLMRLQQERPEIRATVADVAIWADVVRMFEDAKISLEGRIDLLVNNAGVGGAHVPVEDTSVEEWNRVIGVNLTGTFYCVKLAAPVMKAQRAGCIVNISSTSARTGLPNRLPYVTAKAAILGLTRNVARELGPFNIRCNAVLPGAVANERGKALVARRASDSGLSVDESEHATLRYVSMRTWIQPTEIADAVAFLASDSARHISGQLLGVCGNVEWEE